MKAEFDKASVKAELYAKNAMVVTLSIADAQMQDGTMRSADEIRDGFLSYLQENNIPHAVINIDGTALTFATTREKEEGEPKARAAVAGYFKGELAEALQMQAYFQEHTHGHLKDRETLKDITCLQERREVARNLRKMRRVRDRKAAA